MSMPEQDFELSLAVIDSEIQRLEDMPRWFALYMGVHYAKRGAAGGALGEGKPAPPLLSQDVVEYIIELFGSVTVAEVLKLRQRARHVKFKKMEKAYNLLLGKTHHLCFPIQPIWGFYFDFEHFHKNEVGVRKSNEKRAKDLQTVRKSNEKRAKDLATLLPTQDRNLRSRGAKPTRKSGGPIKQPGGGFRGN
jgi:hypothetical protein